MWFCAIWELVHRLPPQRNNVIMPPKSQRNESHQSGAVPDSNAPISLDDITNIVLIDETRPRMASGVRICFECGFIITTLIVSNNPLAAKITSKEQRMCWVQNLSCKLQRRQLSTAFGLMERFFMGGVWQKDGGENGSKAGAVLKILVLRGNMKDFTGKAGSIATAPPNKTANISTANTVNNILCDDNEFPALNNILKAVCFISIFAYWRILLMLMTHENPRAINVTGKIHAARCPIEPYSNPAKKGPAATAIWTAVLLHALAAAWIFTFNNLGRDRKIGG